MTFATDIPRTFVTKKFNLQTSPHQAAQGKTFGDISYNVRLSTISLGIQSGIAPYMIMYLKQDTSVSRFTPIVSSRTL